MKERAEHVAPKSEIEYERKQETGCLTHPMGQSPFNAR